MSENENYESTTPAPALSEETAKSSTNSSGNESNGGKRSGSDLKELASGVCIVIYGYISALKNEGHTSMGNLLFQEMMNMNAAASLASESIGRDKFIENLEKGFYSSGRLLVYLDFCGTLDKNNTMREAIIESVTGIHKIFAASVKTVKSKQAKQTMCV